jgi:hypothetical protein
MGCDLLGLDLGSSQPALPSFLLPFGFADTGRTVRNWEFLQPTTRIAPSLGGEVDPLKLLKRRTSLVVADLPVLSAGLGESEAPEPKSDGQRRPQEQQQKQQPTVFQEPDANSLLDSFGF